MTRQFNRIQFLNHFIQPLETSKPFLLGFQKRRFHQALIQKEAGKSTLPHRSERNENRKSKCSFYHVRPEIFGKPYESIQKWSEHPPRSLEALQHALSQTKDLPLGLRLHTIGRIIDSRLHTTEDHALLLDSWSQLRECLHTDKNLDDKRQVLRFYNALISRLIHFDVPVKAHPRYIKHGLYYSLRAQSTSALQYYANMGKHTALDWPREEVVDASSALQEWIQNDDFQGWSGARRKEELLMLLTGWEIPSGDEEHVKWEPHFRTVFSPFYDCSVREHLFRLLGKLISVDEILRAWAACKHRVASKANRSKLDIDSGDLMSIACEFVEILATLGRGDLAWNLINEQGVKLTSLGGHTLKVLLDYPERITQWDPALEHVLLEKYDELLGKAEHSLGIRWIGGENGYHVMTSESI